MDKWLGVAHSIEQQSRAWVEPFCTSADDAVSGAAQRMCWTVAAIGTQQHCSAAQAGVRAVLPLSGGIHHICTSTPPVTPVRTPWLRPQAREASKASITASLQALEAHLAGGRATLVS